MYVETLRMWKATIEKPSLSNKLSHSRSKKKVPDGLKIRHIVYAVKNLKTKQNTEIRIINRDQSLKPHRDIAQNRRSNKVSLFVAFDVNVSPVQQQLGTFVHAALD